jgi:2-C-methyl-D-erythritol 4-phosphate cytidylyltransferase/2-C-methyl-D-erythritol 2,4-cyclodiphosphate synthase
MRYWLVMPAAGSGRRFGVGEPKQYARLNGQAVIGWALAPFLADPRCAGIVVALAPGDELFAHSVRAQAGRIRTVAGGTERCHSVRAGLAALTQATPSDWVLTHDAARPCLPREDLERLLTSLEHDPLGGLLAVPASDTLKRATAEAHVEGTVDRSGLWRALTPQMFRYGRLSAALDAAFAAGRLPTDEAQALEWLGERPRIVPGSSANLKITTAEDLPLASALLAGARREVAMRIGSGIDVHAFGAGDAVMLGGVRIPHTHGVLAHSDGDVLLHALCDALLGAAGLGDIGQHFRDDDPRWRGADSARFVSAVLEMLKARGLRVVNADLTVLAEAPRVGPHRESIRARIASLLETEVDAVNLKATTTERLGFLGRGEGLAAQAVVLLEAVPER